MTEPQRRWIGGAIYGLLLAVVFGLGIWAGVDAVNRRAFMQCVEWKGR